MARGQVYFDGSHRGHSVNVAEDQNSVVLGGSDAVASDPPGFGPHSVGARYKASLPKTLDPFGGTLTQKDTGLPSGGKQVHQQLPGRKVTGDGS